MTACTKRWRSLCYCYLQYSQMTSVERVGQYIDITPEAPLETSHKPPPGWPQEGGITLQDASLRYSDDGPQVLHNITCTIKPQEKVSGRKNHS